MGRQLLRLAAMATVLLPLCGWAADGPEPKPASQASADQAAFSDIAARTNGDPVLLTQPERCSAWDGRFGWWAMSHTGSTAKTGEYQNLDSSPFWDVDGMTSDGERTIALTATGTDNESTSGNLYFYNPGLTAKVEYERFPHQLDHDPLSNDIYNSQNPADYTTIKSTAVDPKVFKTDLGAGEDYAVRVQELKASFKGLVCDDNVKVRLDVWGLKKDGIRQTNAVAMCYNGNPTPAVIPPDHYGPGGAVTGPLGANRCHVLSQPQAIDWTTTEIKPVVEMRLGESITLEYSRPMRTFTADDETDYRYYDRTGDLSYNNTTKGKWPNGYPYGVVPDSYTSMDQLKISGIINDENRFYGFMMAGSTVQQEIDMSRWFNNVDLRWTNTSIENVTLTGYGKVYNEAEQMPNTAAVAALDQPYSSSTFTPSLDHPIDYHNTTAGAKGVWRVRGGGFDQGGLSITAGYEYCDLERAYAIYDFDNGGEIDQSQTITHSFQIGPDWRWSSCFDTYLRYKYQNADQPLLGVQEANGLVNTPLPQHDNIVEIGFNWFPSEKFIMNACIGVERGDTHGQFGDATLPTNFDQENYPMSFNVWYAVTERLSLSAAYSIFSNFVAQDVTVADQSQQSFVPPASRWTYGGRAQVVTVGSRYLLTEQIRLTGDFEWVRGHDQVTSSATTVYTFTGTNTAVVPDLGSYSDVLNESQRIRLGVDWTIRPRIVTYARYELYRFDDKVPGYQTGLAQGVLGGVSMMF